MGDSLVEAALTIAGSDPTGGAGIQADLQVFASLGVHGCAVPTALTTQDTARVHKALPLRASSVAAQLNCLLADVEITAAKTGMLVDVETVRAVADCLASHADLPLVIDPVIRSSSGKQLLAGDGVAALIERLIPGAALVTPNTIEAEILIGAAKGDVCSLRTMAEAGRRIRELGAQAVLVKAGHMPEPIDVLVDKDGVLELPGIRIDLPGGAHGTGCVLSAAITAMLASGSDLRVAVANAKKYITAGLQHRRQIGHGAPVVDYAAGALAVRD